MNITVDMVFSKEYIKAFAFSLSINSKALEFPKRDRLNSMIRSYLVVSRTDYKPRFGNDVTKIVVPVNGRVRNAHGVEILPKKCYQDLERDFEDLFFSLFHRIDSAGVIAHGKRTFARQKYLEAAGITPEMLTEDAFRKLFDRYRKKKEAQIVEFLANTEFSLASLYKSGRNNFTHSTPENVQN